MDQIHDFLEPYFSEDIQQIHTAGYVEGHLTQRKYVLGLCISLTGPDLYFGT